jgi:hypothetical protein
MVKNNDKFIREIAEEYDIPIFIARQICESPFKFLKETMATKEMKGVMMPYLGKFIVQPNVKYYIQKYRDAEDQDKGDIKSSSEQDNI